jgi:hypothetical protein
MWHLINQSSFISEKSEENSIIRRILKDRNSLQYHLDTIHKLFLDQMNIEQTNYLIKLQNHTIKRLMNTVAYAMQHEENLFHKFDIMGNKLYELSHPNRISNRKIIQAKVCLWE